MEEHNRCHTIQALYRVSDTTRAFILLCLKVKFFRLAEDVLSQLPQGEKKGYRELLFLLSNMIFIKGIRPKCLPRDIRTTLTPRLGLRHTEV